MRKEVTYNGHVITYKCGYYWTLGKQFKTRSAAIKAINNELNKQS